MREDMNYLKMLQIILFLALMNSLFSLEFESIGFNNGICTITDFNSDEKVNESCYSWGISTQLKSKKHANIEVSINLNEFSYYYVGDPRVGLVLEDSTYIQKVENTVSIIPLSLTLKPSYNFNRFLIHSNIGLSFLIIRSTLIGTETNTKTTGSNYCFGIPLRAGVSYNVNDKFGIDFSLGTTYKFENSPQEVDGYTPLTQSFFLFNAGLGMFYNFDR
jgi:opacity protein-like surface antigen